MADICTTCGMNREAHELPLRTGACVAYCLLPLPAVQPSPFPPEVVERAAKAIWDRDPVVRDNEDVDLPTPFGWLPEEDRADLVKDAQAALSVIADYLRSEEARERVRDAVLINSGGSLGTVATAVISALLGEKP